MDQERQERSDALKDNLLRLKSRISGINIESEFREDGCRDMGDQAKASHDCEIEATLRNQKSKELAMIDKALGRLDKGLYGICSECGGPISENRLVALPVAVCCKDCQEKREQIENFLESLVPFRTIFD